ncbi:MAG: hypothetical protein ABI611_19805 [Solirubrobacteraceae bacterium]
MQAAARLEGRRFGELEAALHEGGMIGASIHSYGTLTSSGEQHARERWQASRPLGAFGGPPRLARPCLRADLVIVRAQDRACPNCGAHVARLTGRRTKRWEELRGRGEADFACLRCDGRWTIYLEPGGPEEGSTRSPVARAGANTAAGWTPTRSRHPTTIQPSPQSSSE